MVIGAILVAGASVTASLFVVQVAVIPLLFKYNKTVQRKMVFSNCINYPRNLDYNRPSSCNVVGGRNFQIDFESTVDNCPVKLGVWHIVPCSLFREVFLVTADAARLEQRLHEELKKTSETVVLYCHGNSNHRASPHRLQLYKVFQDLNFHVITFDYRGYGDSTKVRPTEQGVVEDVLRVYSWLIASLAGRRPRVILWGHSLGTAVVANLSAHLPELAKSAGIKNLPYPDALILEAPFNNLTEEIESHPFSKLVSWLPYYKDTFVKPFAASPEYSFTSDQHLATAPRLPVLMLHSRGDRIVPYDLAVKLYETVKRSREGDPGAAPLVFHTFPRGLGLGHNNLCEAPELKDVVSNFLELINKRSGLQTT